LTFAGRYLALTTVLNLAWELAQLPLYTIWASAPLRESLAAAVHCTVGDLAIAAVTLALGMFVAARNWPSASYLRLAIVVVIFGLGYTVLSEWLNVEIRRNWAYVAAMPRLPWFGTGLAPLAQWVTIPTVVFLMLRGCAIPGRSA